MKDNEDVVQTTISNVHADDEEKNDDGKKTPGNSASSNLTLTDNHDQGSISILNGLAAEKLYINVLSKKSSCVSYRLFWWRLRDYTSARGNKKSR